MMSSLVLVRAVPKGPFSIEGTEVPLEIEKVRNE